MHSFGPRLDADIFSAVSLGSHSDNDNLRFPFFRKLFNFVALTLALAIALGGCAGRAEGATGTLSATPSAINFGSVATGVKNSQTVQLKNMGTASLTISGIGVDGPYFSASAMSLPKRLAAGATTSLTVYFAPLMTGSFSGSLVFQTSESDETFSVPLAGTGGSTTRSLTLSSSNVNFGNEIVGGTTTQTINVRNNGNASVTISGVTVSGTGFSTSGGLSGATIAAGQSGTLNVRFAPNSTGTFTGKVTISSTATNSPAYVSTAGTGISSTTHLVTLSWNPSPTVGIAGYNVYRSTESGGPYSRISSTLLTTLSYTDEAVSAGSTYYYVVTAVTLSGLESAHSAQIAATIP